MEIKWAPYCHPDLWLGSYDPTSLEMQSRYPWFTPLSNPKEAPGLQWIWNRRRCEAGRHIQTTDNWHWFILDRVTSLDATVAKIFKCRWRLCRGLTPTCHARIEDRIKFSASEWYLLTCWNFMHVGTVSRKPAVFSYNFKFYYNCARQLKICNEWLIVI